MNIPQCCYWVLFDEEGVWAVARETAGGNENTILFQREVEEKNESHTAEGLQLEAARVILKDYNGLDTSRQDREAFAEGFFPKQQDRRIMPGTIENWLDEEMYAAPEHLRDQKRSGKQ